MIYPKGKQKVCVWGGSFKLAGWISKEGCCNCDNLEMSPGDCHPNVSQIRFDIQLKTKAPLDDPPPGSVILSRIINVSPPCLPPLLIWGERDGVDIWLWSCSVIKRLSPPGLCPVWNTLLSVRHERVQAATVGGLRCDKHQWIFFSFFFFF